MKRYLIPTIILISLFVNGCISGLDGYGGTSPNDLINNTKSEITYLERTQQKTFEEYVNKYFLELSPDEEISDEYVAVPLEPIKIAKFERDASYIVPEDEYLDFCEGTKTDINFENYKETTFDFNYQEYTFDYKIKLFYDLIFFSSSLKNQDCYYQDYETFIYYKIYFSDPYNNIFMDIVSNDFISLREKGFSDDEILEMATIFVQSIPYGTDFDDSNRYPYETFGDGEGNCLDKSIILAQIANHMGYTVYIIGVNSDSEEPHAIVAVECKNGNVEYNSHQLCLIETTVYSPIGSYLNQEYSLDKYYPVRVEGKSYSESAYGPASDARLESKLLEAGLLWEQLEELNSEMESLNEIIEYHEETYIWEGYYQGGQTSYKEYKNTIKAYNRLVVEFNDLLEAYYREWYLIEAMFFENYRPLED